MSWWKAMSKSASGNADKSDDESKPNQIKQVLLLCLGNVSFVIVVKKLPWSFLKLKVIGVQNSAVLRLVNW